MATLAPSLSVTAIDDTMEISSDAGRGDQDIDIDFMGSEHADDDGDWMLQDTDDQEEHGPTNDDLMYDDGDELTYVEEETMQYDDTAQLDQDLEIEYDPHPATEETLYDATLDVDVQHVDAFHQPDEPTLVMNQQDVDEFAQPEEETLIDFDTYPEQGAETTEVNDVPQTDNDASGIAPIDFAGLPVEQHQDIDHENAVEHAAVTQDQVELSNEDQQLPQDGSASTQPQNVTTSDVLADEQPLQEPLPSEQAAASETASRRTSLEAAPSTQPLTAAGTAALEAPITSDFTLPSLHPIALRYAGFKYSMFAVSDDDDPNTYLLKDSSVASSTLTDLFRACRIALGQDVNDEHELRLYIDDLNLTICEDSIQCRDSSLAQIVEVYCDLTRNEGVQNVPALKMELYHEERLSAQLTSLFKHASEKRGLYSLPSYHDRIDEEQETTSGDIEDGGTEESDDEETEIPETQPEDDIYDADVKTERESEGTSLGEKNATALENAEDEQLQAEGHATIATYAAQSRAEHSETLGKDLVEDEVIYEEEYQEEGAELQEEGAQTTQADQKEDQAVLDDVEQGDGASSGSSTIQGENQADPAHDDVNDSFRTARAPTEDDAEGDEPETQQAEATEFDDHGEGYSVEESYDYGQGETADAHDETTFDADNFNQAFDATTDYTGEEAFGEQEYHEDNLENGGNSFEQPNAQDWTYDDTQVDTTANDTQASGTFKVPSSTEDNEEEDEISFDDDDFTADGVPTGDAAEQEPVNDSPRSKRARDEDDDDLKDGSDQESKRLKAD